jgi:hypothetical protein
LNLFAEERYLTLFYMPLYTFLHNLLNVLVQIANKMGLGKIGLPKQPLLHSVPADTAPYAASNEMGTGGNFPMDKEAN